METKTRKLTVTLLLLLLVLALGCALLPMANNVAKADGETYTITFDANGGTGTMAAVEVAGGDYTLPACTFTAPQYQEFDCWQVDETNYGVGDAVTIAGNTVVKAIWKDIQITFVYDANGGTGTMDPVTKTATEVASGYYLVYSKFTAPEGKDFVCWDIDGTMYRPLDKKYKDTTSTTVTVKAVWGNLTPIEVAEITISDDLAELFATDQTEGAVQTALRGKGVSAVGTEYTVNKLNSWLMYWHTSIYDSGSWYGIGDGSKYMSVDRTYKFEFRLDTKQGYKFTESTVGKVNGSTDGVTMEHDEYGHYTLVYSIVPTVAAIKYNVSFNANGGTGTMETVRKAGEYTLPACTFTAPEGKCFKAWKLGETELAANTVTLTADIELVAVWQDHNFATTYLAANSDSTKHYHVCEYCNTKDGGEAHTFNVEAATEETDKHCTVCGYVAQAQLSHTHVGTVHNGTEPTCGAAGEKTYYTCTCGKAFEESACTTEIENLNTWKVIPATGEHTYDNACDATCNVCGATRTPADHIWTEATCTEPVKCSVCGTVKGPALGHTGGTATCEHKAVCTRCEQEYGELAAHTGGTATCTAKAVCEVCGNEYGELVAHNYAETWSKDETNHWHACANCDTKKDSAAHTPDRDAADGEHAKVCSVCGYVIAPALGHICGNGEKIDGKAATCTEAGWKDYFKCDGCEKLYKEASCETEIVDLSAWKAGDGKIDALGHDLVDSQAVAATCTAAGKTEGKHCSRCDYTEGGEVVAALGHTGGTATCAAKAVCTRCEQEYGELAAHTYADTWSKDETKHWHECSVCHGKKDEAAHTYTNGTCVCGAVETVTPPAPVTVNIGANGGSGTMSGITVEEGKITLPQCAYSAPEGKQFDCYVVNGVKYNAGDKVDYAEGMTVTVVWKDKTADTPNNPDNPNQPDDGKGLSGGAIAGIVIGSVFGAIIVACGVFALVWFVVKKKTWAELVTMLKGLFQKKPVAEANGEAHNADK